MHDITLTLNGAAVTARVAPGTTLVALIRDQLALTGTHIGCDTAQCGACMVHVDGVPVKSCAMLAVQADGRRIGTIEGIAEDGRMSALQAAFREHHALQCGFCTPGMVMSAAGIIDRHGADVDDATIRRALEGNICRCTGYHNIVKAIRSAAAATA
ncbi:(2Fe-2S)-binding protein [Tistrella sp. BH-R2-4]|uniref:(2Fe-2S)-binding protein n=1 Tax=Tistrella arctica TaxID=3133430 RepID=A0ABU9YDE1_9PROT